MSKAQLNCAIYTRKSTEEGLEQAFNTLDAQREACAAYISSQKHEGWHVLSAQYDDGGYTGGNMERPALKKLMADSRVFGATTSDVDTSWKVEVAARYARGLGFKTSVSVLCGHLGKDIPVEKIETCDIILSCVDRHLPRALLNRLSYSKAIPVIDMGSAFRVDNSGKINGGAGRVVIVGPGRPCLACWGHIDPQRMRIEALPPEEREKQTAEGYIDGSDISQPSVIAFNTMVAGAAVTELLRLATHFAGLDDPPLRLGFDFMTGSVRRNALSGSNCCSICARASQNNDNENWQNGSGTDILGAYIEEEKGIKKDGDK